MTSKCGPTALRTNDVRAQGLVGEPLGSVQAPFYPDRNEGLSAQSGRGITGTMSLWKKKSTCYGITRAEAKQSLVWH
jgi:hypothetical protein